MEQSSFENTVLTLLQQVPKGRREAVLRILETVVHALQEPQPEMPKRQYSVERHREVRRLTATIRGSLAESIVGERDERG